MTTTTTDQQPGAEQGVTRRVLQRVVLPADRDLDVLPLYIDYGAAASLRSLEEEQTTTTEEQIATVDVTGTARHPENILDRRRLRVHADQRVSFATYFNGFAASYWRMYSIVDKVILRVRVSGSATVIVYRSTADGRSQRVDSATTQDDPSGDFEFTLPLKPFGDGGWYWFDLFAGREDAVLEEAEWSAYVPADKATSGRLTIGCTTFNRTGECVALLNQLADDDQLKEILDELIVIDQGTEKVRDEEDFALAEKGLGSQLRVIEQANIGGSGGFARGQYETVTAGRSDYAMMLDDDVVAEPESFVRAVTFGDLARTPTIVGGHMFSMYSRAQLHSYGEMVNQWRFWWGPATSVRTEHDFAAKSLRRTRWLHKRVDVDYTGWWMCLIPRVVLDEVGLGLPLFIKWDDAEYGLRAGKAGYPTVSMPGVAVWHVPWTDKNDALDWQAYFHQRNRTVAALLHSPYDYGGRMVRESFNHQVKHLLAMQYSTAEQRLLAIQDVLEGPEHLHPSILDKLAEVRALRARFTDAQAQPHPSAFPPVKKDKPPKRGKDITDPKGVLGQIKAAAIGGVRQVLRPRERAETNPEARLSARDARWWRLAQLDSVVVSTTDGTAASWYKRDRQQFQRLLVRSIAVHERLQVEWPALAKRYRQALDEVTSPQTWQKTFEAARPPREDED